MKDAAMEFRPSSLLPYSLSDAASWLLYRVAHLVADNLMLTLY